MALFTIAYNETAPKEGGYSNNPKDNGGETWRGIARKLWPSWKGWVIIDALRAQKAFPSILATSAQLQGWVLDFYKKEFWDVMSLDTVENQVVANKLYDISVNMGVGVAGTMLQRALNVLNKNGKLYPDLVVDGKVGKVTIKALNAHPSPSTVFKALNVLQGERYIELSEKSPSQEEFTNGWLGQRIAALASDSHNMDNIA